MREVKYYLVIEDGAEIEIRRMYGLRQATAERLRIKQNNPGIICRIVMR